MLPSLYCEGHGVERDRTHGDGVPKDAALVLHDKVKAAEALAAQYAARYGQQRAPCIAHRAAAGRLGF